MIRQHITRRKNCLWGVLTLFLLGLLAPSLRAEPIGQSSSLKFVPADAAFYCSVLRNREKFDALVKSNAFKAFLNIPAIKTGVDELKQQWDEPENPGIAIFKAMLAMPENKQLVELLTDMVSHEVFIYGDSGFGELLVLLNEVNRLQQQFTIEALKDGGEPDAEMMAQKIAALLAKNADKIKIPQTVIGFRQTDAARAKAQLGRLEGLLNAVLAQQPDLKMRFQKQQVGGGEYLVFTLDGTMIPWDEFPLDKVPAEIKGDVDKLIAKVKATTLSISLGVREEYILLSIAPSTDHLKALGQGELLINRQEFAALRKDGDKPITSIGYISKQFVDSFGSPKQGIDDLVAMAQGFIPLARLEEDISKRLSDDARELGEDLKKYIPEPGARMGYCFFTDTGFEGYSYDWSENLVLDGSKPLTILDHLGGNPIFYGASRQKSSQEGYAMTVKWAKKAFTYFDYFALQNMPPEVQEKYKKFRDSAKPLIARFDETTSKKLIPSLSDGQSACVIDAKLLQDRWHDAMPPSTTGMLPMLEIGLVVGVSDAELLKQAFVDYYDIAQQLAYKLHEAAPEIPKIKFVKPYIKEFPSGTVYFFTFLKKMGFDQRIALNAGLSDKFAAVSMLPLHTKRLLDSNPLPTDALSADREKPLAAASGCNFAGLVEAVRPWIDYAVSLEADPDDDEVKEILPQIHTGLDILKCFRGCSSVTYLQEGAKVKHYEVRFEDLK